MENDKPLTREALVSMQVIDSKGRLVGKVKDIIFAVGKNGISIAVENDNGEIRNIAWEDVQAASDFIILKSIAQAVAATNQQTQSAPLCQSCGKPLTWIPQYQRWYCYNDKKYA